jgi:predicted metal-dependent hydrolase
MQLGLPFRRQSAAGDVVMTLGGRPVSVGFVRHRRARHYILHVGAEGRVRVTLPWYGSKTEALRFVEERRAWIERERYKRAVSSARRGPWGAGTEVLFRGTLHALRVAPADARHARVAFADQALTVPVSTADDLRVPVERHLRRLAEQELPARLRSFATRHAFVVKAVSVRGQRSRWGSCSPSGRISLNWRLIQFPDHVADYVLIHELVHLLHLNHSRRFWAGVARLCPAYQEARAWLRRHQRGDEDAL